jgi:hypothetical protein
LDQIESLAPNRHFGQPVAVSMSSLIIRLVSSASNSRLLDAQLLRCIEDGTMLNFGKNDLVLKAMLALLTSDGLSG